MKTFKIGVQVYYGFVHVEGDRAGVAVGNCFGYAGVPVVKSDFRFVPEWSLVLENDGDGGLVENGLGKVLLIHAGDYAAHFGEELREIRGV